MDKNRRNRRLEALFFSAYFVYYAAYCVFSSYIVLYLTENGYAASVCGVLTSLTLAANLLMEPVGGYITDTFLTTRRYLLVCVAVIAGLCLFCTACVDWPWLLLPAMVATAGIMYPFSQLMDAWVNMSREEHPELVYSRIRAGGSVGFAGMSVLAGFYFRSHGWNSYFLMQMALFFIMVPFLLALPDIKLGNGRPASCVSPDAELPGNGNALSFRRLTFRDAFRVAAGNRRYRMCLFTCTLYWFSHRPVGSYLSLIVAARGGDAAAYGNICGVGAVVESAGLLLLAWLMRRKPMGALRCLEAALITDLLRPLCILLIPGIWSLYGGQMLQSVSFALFYSGSVDCFTETADPRIRSFCISFGLTISSVAGTILANLLGGVLCDWRGTGLLVAMSLTAAAANLACFWVYGKRSFCGGSLRSQ